MPSDPMERSHSRLLLAAGGILLPVIVFYGVLLRYVVNIPTLDDYDSALELVTRIAAAHGLLQRLALLFSAEHNGYRLILAGTVFWYQYDIFGKLNLALSSVLGDVVPIALAFVLWLIFLPRVRPLGLRLALFVPVALLIFQLNYVEALNAPMTGLQHVPALTFAMLGIYLLLRVDRGSFAGAAVCMVLSVLSSTNGFLLFPVGLLMLVQRKLWRRAGVWTALALMGIVLYRYHYVPGPPLEVVWKSSFLMALLVWKPLYTMGVLGAAAAPFGVKATFVLGAVLVGLGIYFARCGYFQRNPAVGYCALFLLLTAMGIAHIRLSLGLEYSSSSRYRMYSDVLLAFVWFAVAEEYVLRRAVTLTVPLRQSAIYVTAVALTALYAMGADWQGRGFLRDRYWLWVSGVSAWEHPTQPEDVNRPMPVLPGATEMSPAFAVSRRIFEDAIAHGVYEPPQYPERITPPKPKRLFKP